MKFLLRTTEERRRKKKRKRKRRRRERKEEAAEGRKEGRKEKRKDKEEAQFKKRNGATMVAPSQPRPPYCFTLDPLHPLQNLNFYLKGSLVFVSVIGIPEILVIVTRQDGIIYTYRIRLNLMLFRQFGTICEVLSLVPPLDFSRYFLSSAGQKIP